MRNTNFKPFIFFSPIEAIAFSEAARNLLAWAGMSYPAESFTLVRERIRSIETSESHRLPLEDAEELFALLGTCAMSNRTQTSVPPALERLRSHPVPQDCEHSGVIMEWTINRIEDLSEELHDLVQELEDRYGDLKEALFFALKDGEITKEAAEDMDKKNQAPLHGYLHPERGAMRLNRYFLNQ